MNTEKKKTKSGLIFLDKTKLYVYAPDKKSVFTFDIQPQVIKDMEVLNIDLLETQLMSFLDNNKLTAFDFILVLSKSLCFEKDFIKGTNFTQEQIEIAAQQYIDHVPFETVGSKIISLEKGIKVIATNAELYEAIISVLQKRWFQNISVIPASLFGNVIEKLDQSTIRIISHKAESLKKYSLLGEQEFLIAETPEEKIANKKKQRYLLVLAIGLFVAAAILIYFAIFGLPA